MSSVRPNSSATIAIPGWIAAATTERTTLTVAKRLCSPKLAVATAYP